MKSIEEYRRLNDEAVRHAKALKGPPKPRTNWKKKYEYLVDAVRSHFAAMGKGGPEESQASEHLWRLTHDESVE
jgi:hypothetical protein